MSIVVALAYIEEKFGRHLVDELIFYNFLKHIFFRVFGQRIEFLRVFYIFLKIPLITRGWWRRTAIDGE